MSETHELQHLDIKPQNLLLVGNRIKVADFGLVKDLGGATATGPSGVTPVYATPETFDGRVSRYSDQYSLAIVYQEMLTGVRPFPGTTMMQLMAQHVNSPPLLTPLPGNDRVVIGKALSKTPEHRFPSCLKMVDALLAGGRDADTAPVGPSRRLAAQENDLAFLADPSPASVPYDTSMGLNQQTLPKPSAVLPCEAKGQSGLNPRPVIEAVSTGAPGLRPTLFLGIGGLAAATLRRLKNASARSTAPPPKRPSFAFSWWIPTAKTCGGRGKATHRKPWTSRKRFWRRSICRSITGRNPSNCCAGWTVAGSTASRVRCRRKGCGPSAAWRWWTTPPIFCPTFATNSPK